MFCMGILILCVSVDILVLLTCSVWAFSSSKCWLAGVVDMFCMGILIPDWYVYIYMFKLSVSCPREPESLCFIPDWSVCVFQLSCLRKHVCFISDWIVCVCVCVSVAMSQRACVFHSWLKYVCVLVVMLKGTSVFLSWQVYVFQLSCLREHVCFNPDWSVCVSVVVLKGTCVFQSWLKCVCVFQLACPKEPVSFNSDGSLDQTKVRLVRPLHHKCMHYSQMKYTTPGTLEYDSINSIRLVRPLHHKCMHYSQMKYTRPSTL